LRGLWAGGEIGIKHPVAIPVIVLLSGALTLCYPIVGGIVFFRHPWASQMLQIAVVKYSLLFLGLNGQLMLMAVTWSILSSEDIDDDTRQRIFINQIGGLIPTAIFAALAFWAFGLGGTPLTLDFIGAPEGTLSLQTLLLLLVFFGVTVLVPYLVGTQRARIKNLDFLKKVRGYVTEIAEILAVPTGSLYVVRLTALRDKIVSSGNQLVNSDPLLLCELSGRQNPEQVPADKKDMLDAIGKSRDLDVRFRFLEELKLLENELEGIVADLQKRDAATIEVAAEHWSKTYQNRKAERDKTIETTASKKPFVTATVGSMVMLIVSGVLSEVGKFAWQLIAHVPK
jgi:hypothetical protein